MSVSRSVTKIKRGDFLINENEIQYGKSGKYQIETILGQGGFGKVVKCVNLDTKEVMAVKIVRNRHDWVGRREVAILKKLRELDQDKNNLVKFSEHFSYKGCMCLTFELLDLSIWHFMKKRKFEPLHLSEIRVITQQMLVAVEALKSIGLVHADIKPDNVMLVNHTSQPLRVKLIDFGLARPVNRLQQCMTVQAVGYRAPEVFLGLPLNEAIDMWSLGCVVAYMYIGQNLYVGDFAFEVMRVITQIHGQPEDHLLDSGVKTMFYFKKEKDPPGASWRPRTPELTMQTSSSTSSQSTSSTEFTSLDDLTKARPKVKNRFEREDTKAFLSFLKHVLRLDAEKRMTASQALGHRFITLRHLSSNPKAKDYLSSVSLMTKNNQLEETIVEEFITSSEVVKCKGSHINTSDHPRSAGASKIHLNKTYMMGRNCRIPLDRTLISASHNPNTITNDGTTEFVEIKTRKKNLKRIRTFFSKLSKYMCWK
ncbi:hypothetical protein Q5P01_010730 [Channa striata]|uniref:Protein kinase domain-containing protein n=1 Tax=Channa striata TaxID=64152 RepID=A0AA88MRW3_CHASR|nr:hypothetical protein Q5P01_010730 [Channa striata]